MEDHPFTEGKGRPDVVLVVGEQRFHVNKSVLMVASPVFEKLLDGEFKEKYAKEVPLDDDPQEFLTFLRCLYPSVWEPVTAQNALAVLKAADKYQVESLIQLCESVLAEHCKTLDPEKTTAFRALTESDDVRLVVASTIVTYIEASEKYGLKKLLPVCISKAVTVNSEAIKKSKISKETQLEIYRRRVESFESLHSDLGKVREKDRLWFMYTNFRDGKVKYWK